MPNFVILSVIILSVIILSVLASNEPLNNWQVDEMIR
jgi:hypothetical protein